MPNSKPKQEPFEIEFSNGSRALVTDEERNNLLKDGIRIKGAYQKPSKQEITINASIRFLWLCLCLFSFKAFKHIRGTGTTSQAEQ